ncbi:MAG: glycosyltransferase family 2 protein [Proteobacteria bacterium]|nr:glycosyltransferase family 2 protein [Pseudomonadota bacterium]
MQTPKIDKDFKVTIVIPVHNEEEIIVHNVTSIVERVGKIKDLSWEILLVENGSTDRTLELIKEMGSKEARIKYIVSEVANYGAALQTGFIAADGDIIVSFDIDYWDIKFLEVAAYVMQVRYDIIIASKNLLLSKDRRSFLRKCASMVFRYILFFVFGLRVTDTHGIKAWRNNSKLKQIFKDSYPAHHTYDTEIIVRAMHQDCEVLEVPVEVIENRTNDRSIVKRVPKALKELYSMHQRLKLK